MERTILKDLQGWKGSRYRKPLYLQGVNRSGKTWVLKEFGKQYYKNTVYISLREQEEYKQFFQKKEIFKTEDDYGKRILQSLMLSCGQRILPEKTLLILDDVQDCPEVIDTLEAFHDQAPQFHIICAGTPLQRVFPIEKINRMELGPMTFTETLKADGNEELAEYIEDIHSLSPVPEMWFQILSEKLKVYFVTGGMPEAVHTWIHKREVDELQGMLSRITGMYEHAFAAYTDKKTFPKVLSIWKSVPSQLARENKKFFYKLVKEGARAREYENALNWLSDTQYVRKIYRSHVPGTPLSAFDDLSAFRVYLPDVGLLRRMSRIPPSAFTEGKRLFTEACGALTENYILSSLTEQFHTAPRYWSQNNPFHDVDFILQKRGIVVPAEINPTAHREGRGMKRYEEKFGEKLRLHIRFSMDNLKFGKKSLNIPLFLADATEKLMEIVLS